MRTAIYKKTTGEIVMAAHGSENDCLFSLRQLGLADHSYIEGAANPATQYVDVTTEELRDKQIFDVSTEGNTISNVPVGTVVRLPDRSRIEIAASKKLTIDVDFLQVVKLELRHPHYLDGEVVMELTP